jgi:hypothetical protein
MTLFNKPDYADITLTINDGTTSVTIPAHRSILANRSDFFDRLFRYPNASNAASIASASSVASTAESVPIKNYSLNIAQYGILEEFLDILEHSIYGCRPISYEQIQYQTNLLNYLLIDGITYAKKYLTKTRFVIYSASLSSKSVILYDPTSREAYMQFETDDDTNEHKLTISSNLCYNIEFLDYLASLIPELNNEFANKQSMKKIKKRGLLITKLSDIQRIIESLYAMNVITDKKFPYVNVLTRVIFHQAYSVFDPIYLRTKELSVVNIDIGYYTTWIGVTFSIIDTFEKRLAIFIIINNDNIHINISVKNVKIDDTPTFFLVIEWIRIFFDVDLTKHSDMDVTRSINLLRIPTDGKDHLENRQKVCAMLSYLNISDLFPIMKTTDRSVSTIKYTLKNDLGLVFDNEYRSTNSY